MWLQGEDYSQQFKDPEESVKNLIKIRTAKRLAGGDGQFIIWWGCAEMLLSWYAWHELIHDDQIREKHDIISKGDPRTNI